MDNVIPLKIQIVAIIGSLLFLLLIGRLIVKGKLRIEYSIVWILSTVVLIVFSFWRNGIELIASVMGVYYAPALIFMFAIFAIIIFLVHISVVNSKQHNQIKELSRELGLLKQKWEEANRNRPNQS